jgi:chemotaxis protein histidine kinase CheA
MADEANPGSEAGEVVESVVGTPSFSAVVETKDPLQRTQAPPPEGVPEKFWDPDKGQVRMDDLLKSYTELEKKFSAPKEDTEETEEAAEESQEETEEASEEASEESAEETEEETSKETEETSEAVDLSAAMEAAQTVYAEKGELPAEARDPFLKAGFSNEQIDLYLAGVKAHEEGLKSAAMKAAGVEDYGQVEAAIAWAAENWTPKKIAAFNAQAGDVDTVGLAVTALFNDYRGSNPGEGRLTSINSGGNRGDVYNDRREFDADLKKADDRRDPVARKAAIQKMDRSIKAGSLKK